MTRSMTVALALLLALFAASCGSSRDGNAVVANIGDLGHVHDVVVENDEVYVAAHSGLFRLEGRSRAVLIGEFRHDFMSMTTGPDGLVASGHPDLRYDEWRVEGKPAHLGFLSSTDLGATWQKVALLGDVDFHSLTSRADSGFYGADSSGGILASDDGITWETRSEVNASDVEGSPQTADSVLAIDSATGQLISSTDGARSWNVVDTAPALQRVQWLDDSVVGITADGTIYSASDPGQDWTEIARVDADIVAFTTQGNEWWIVTDQAAVFHSDDGDTYRVVYEPPDRPGQ